MKYKLSLLVSGVSHILWLRKVSIFSLHSTPCYGVESEIKTGSHLVEGDCTTQLPLIIMAFLVKGTCHFHGRNCVVLFLRPFV